MTLSKEAWDFKLRVLPRFHDIEGQPLWDVIYSTEDQQPENFEESQYNQGVDDCWAQFDWNNLWIKNSFE